VHRRPRRCSIVDEHDHFVGKFRQSRGPSVSLLPALELTLLSLDDRRQITRVQTKLLEHPMVVDDDTAAGNAPDRELWIERRPELADHEHVDRRSDGSRDLAGNRHATARQTENDGVAPEIEIPQPGPEAAARFAAITEYAVGVTHGLSHGQSALRTSHRNCGSYVYSPNCCLSRIGVVDRVNCCESAEKLAYLRQPSAFPDVPDAVEVVETHFAWVFISRRYVYKLKKPIRFLQLDLTTPSARRANCELEVALNRRLAANTYIGVVPLGLHGSSLRLEADTQPIDWLVKMRRLPREQSLEALLPTLDTNDPRLAIFMDTLCAFYRRAVRAPWNTDDFARTQRRQSMDATDQLMLPELESEHETVRAVAASQLRFVERNYTLIADRISSRRVRDAHGDLRPEHVFLISPPQVIDCLEFSAELRQLDTAEEISFLALECELRGRPDIAERLFQLYSGFCEDTVPVQLYDYYRSRRALVRAFLCASHFTESPDENTLTHWLHQTRWYIGTAASSIERANH